MNFRPFNWLINAALFLYCLPALAQTSKQSDRPYAFNEKTAIKNDGASGSTDEIITKNDDVIIRYKAQMVVSRFLDLLTFISTGIDLELPEVEKVIRQSYTHPDFRIFYDSTIIIEDDLRQTASSDIKREKTIARYLKEFDLLYKKTNEASVAFTNIKTSNVKKGNYLYIKVFYDCLFTNKSRISDDAYIPQKRVAELKLEKVNNKWNAFIIDIHFLNLLDDTNDTKNDVVVKAENVINGDKAVVGQKDLDNMQAKIREAGKNMEILKAAPADVYQEYMKEALYAENGRKYSSAVEYYRLALSKKPEENAMLSAKIQELNLRIDNLSRLDARYIAGEYREAIPEYTRALKKDPGVTDYFIGRGKCYERIKEYDQAMKDFQKAIERDPYNLQAHKLKAALHEVQGSYPEALAEYAVCTGIDKSNISLLQKMAWLNVALGNHAEAVIALDKAISIDHNMAWLHNLKGELLYKLSKPAEARESFSSAIRIDSAKGYSYYGRGLCQADLKELGKAVEDLNTAKRLGIESTSHKRIQQIAADWYKTAVSTYDPNKPYPAMTMLNYAISVEPGNDQYRLKKGEWALLSNDPVLALQCYTEAVQLNPNNYEAFKQRGMIKMARSNYEGAIADFRAAIKINAKDTESNAYLELASSKIKK